MDGVTVSVVRDRGRVLLVLAAVAAVAAPWYLVARKLGDAHPPTTPTLHATSLVWGGRVFTSPVPFARWLRSRGASYTTWKRKHPQLAFGTAAEQAAAARSDTSALAAKAKQAKQAKRHTAAPEAKHRKAAQGAARSRPSGKPTAAAKAKRPAARAPAPASHTAAAANVSKPAAPASGRASPAAGAAAEPGRGGHALEVILLLFGCFVVLAGTGAPAVLRLVTSRGWAIPFEARLLAVATGVSLALAGVIAGGFV